MYGWNSLWGKLYLDGEGGGSGGEGGDDGGTCGDACIWSIIANLRTDMVMDGACIPCSTKTFEQQSFANWPHEGIMQKSRILVPISTHLKAAHQRSCSV